MAEEQPVAAASKEQRSTGKVVRFNDKHGYGFIKPDDGGDDLFVHHSAIKSDGGYRTLYEDDVVEFTVTLSVSDDKYQASNVTAPGGAALKRRTSSGGFNRKSNNGGGGYGGHCYNCGDTNHIARDCNNKTYNRSGINNNNNDYNRGGGGDLKCYNCGSNGHYARDCTRGNRNNGGGGSCFNCGGVGHLARDCTGGKGVCYNCGGHGHMARECTSQRGSGGERFGLRGAGSGNACFHCGEEGHFARHCPYEQ